MARDSNDKIMQVEKPIVNSPFDEPKTYWEISKFKEPKLAKRRRPAKYFYRVPETAGRRHKRKRQEDGLDLFDDRHAVVRNSDEHEYDFDVNDMRRRVKKWREGALSGGAPYDEATPITRALLRHWWSHDRKQRLFFCQLEAAETIIFLQEAPKKYRKGMGEVPRDIVDERQEVDPFIRYACKMATGTGKTTVMGMLVAWSILNSRNDPRGKRFSDTVLIMCPSITIRNRLQELDPTNGDGSIYWTRDLVPRDMLPRMAEGEVMIANWHKLEVRECNEVNGAKSNVTRNGVKTPIIKNGKPTGKFKYLESDEAWMKRVRRELSRGSRGRSARWLVFNDEAHHAYRRGDAYDDAKKIKVKDYSTESDAYNERTATVWIDGLDRINRMQGGGDGRHGISMCVDLSATPFYLQCTGNDVGRPFPWIVSDFSLLDSIESGLVKIPQLPSRDGRGGDGEDDRAAYFNIWRHIQKQAEADGLGKRMTPNIVMNYAAAPINVLAEDWKSKFKIEWDRPTPPVFIVVCNNTKIAEDLYKWISGEPTGKAYAVPPAQFRNTPGNRVTIRVDTATFKEIESGGGKGDAKLLRFTLDTIGKTEWPGGSPPADWAAFVEEYNAKAANDETGKMRQMDLSIPPGRDIRCIVSVSMLTEGWDANNVTHIVGLRPFGSQLLCEQVIGRALRRQSYAIKYDKLLSEETATVFGVPFELVPFKTNVVKPKDNEREMNQIYTVDSKVEFRIAVPKVVGYVPAGSSDIDVDWKYVPKQQLVGLDRVEVKQLTASDGRDLAHGAGKTENLDPENVRRNFRKQQVAFTLARNVCDRYLELSGDDDDPIPLHALFRKVLPHAIHYMDEKIIAEKDRDVRDIAVDSNEMNKAVHALGSALRKGGGKTLEVARVPLKRDSEISTDNVDFPSARRIRVAEKCHLNAMLIDSELEGDAGKVMDMHPGVKRWVKNDVKGLGLLIPYWNRKGLKSEYEPDFVVVTDKGVNVIVEMKGVEDDPARIKAKAAERWVAAVNNTGEHGQWAYIMVQLLGDLRVGLDQFCEMQNKMA